MTSYILLSFITLLFLFVIVSIFRAYAMDIRYGQEKLNKKMVRAGARLYRHS